MSCIVLVSVRTGKMSLVIYVIYVSVLFAGGVHPLWVLPMAMHDNCDDLQENVLQTAMIQEIEIQDYSVSITQKVIIHSLEIHDYL